jgi:hypothetical protein
VPADLERVPFGPPAFVALRARVDAVKRDDALAPATVVVPTNSVGVAARRSLARSGAGIAGVSFLTSYRLAELIGGPRLAAQGRRPVSNPILAAAARHALAATPGRFAPVAAHRATELALVRAHRELDHLDNDELRRLSRASGRARDVVRLHRAMRAMLEPSFHTECDLFAAARDALPALLAGFGTLVVFLPAALPAGARDLLVAAALHTDVHVIAGCTGLDRLDTPADELARAFNIAPTASSALPALRDIDQIVSVSDPDDEAREITRRVIDAARQGVPLERMAIVFAHREPYARLLHEHLGAAGIAHNGVAVRRLADSVAGRTLVLGLGLGDHDLRRRDVLEFAAAAPLRDGGSPVPTARWDRLSRAAGVISGAEQWTSRLAAAQARLGPDHRDHRALADLARFVDRLANRRDRAAKATTWSGLAAIAREILRDHLVSDMGRASWPAEEQRAFDHVELIVDRLGALDSIEAATDLDSFRRALDTELDADLERVGRIGEGVLVGSVAYAAGVETDAVFVAGLAEGSFPSIAHDDSLLPDIDRAAAGAGVLADRHQRELTQHRALLAVIANCVGQCTFLHPRGDLRRTTDRPLSRYAVDAIERLTGRRPGRDDAAAIAGGRLETVASFAAGVVRTPFPATARDLRLRRLTLDRADARTLAGHPIVRRDTALARGVEMVLARASDEFTRFDGNLAGRSIPSLTDPNHVVSATRLERYVANPFESFLTDVLGVRLPDDPDRIEQISAIDLGSLFHLTLERFLVEHVAPLPSKPWDEIWSVDERRRLHEIGAAVAAEFEAAGLTGRRVLWQQARRDFVSDLNRFLSDDDLFRRDHRCTPVAAELGFGFDPTLPPVDYALSDGRTLRFRGAADRIDRTADGGYIVTDYKTGKSEDYAAIDEFNPDECGTRLQLPVYSRAARAAFSADDPAATEIVAVYRFLTERGAYRKVLLPDSQRVRDRIDVVLRSIVDLVEAGVFPNRADPPRRFGWPRVSVADPDGGGLPDMARMWQRKANAPELRAYLALAEPAEDATETADTGAGR